MGFSFGIIATAALPATGACNKRTYPSPGTDICSQSVLAKGGNNISNSSISGKSPYNLSAEDILFLKSFEARVKHQWQPIRNWTTKRCKFLTNPYSTNR